MLLNSASKMTQTIRLVAFTFIILYIFSFKTYSQTDTTYHLTCGIVETMPEYLNGGKHGMLKLISDSELTMKPCVLPC